mmetsp:Transcript_144068/g.461186  ORF Transcript_144068/g.461186 Transcript_144068/m.461186 type:complete len:568 (+) Transcript_144068:56-1759(+)
MGRAKRETPEEAFENLRQAFDTLKANHSDAWCWHEYLSDEPKDDEGSDSDMDPEKEELKPKKRTHMDRLKQHLLTCVSELNRCAQAADTCFFHMCCRPEKMKPCVIILGTSGDVDEDMLAGGDASPQKIMAMLQAKLGIANDKIVMLEAEIEDLKAKLCESRFESEDHWKRWQNNAMLCEDAMTKLHNMSTNFRDLTNNNNQLTADYRDLYLRHLRASRMMIYKGRQMLRDQVFKVGRKENLFYSFHGFIYTLQKEKEERVRREHEAQRDRVEFALRNEVRFLLGESDRHSVAVRRLALEAGRLKQDRRAFALRIMHKNRRPYEIMEYCLWVWELWQPIRRQLVLEKALEAEQAARDATIQMLVQTTQQLPPLATCIDNLQEDLVMEQIAHDVSKRELTAAGARLYSGMVQQLRVHRTQELAVLYRISELEVEGLKERIAVLEREIAEDRHIHALKGMVVDLESNLRRALDRRKQRAFVVPPSKDAKCSQCSRESLLRSWKGLSQDGASEEMPPGDAGPPLRSSSSLGSLSLGMKGMSPRFVLPTGGSKLAALPPPELRGTYSAVWR